MKKRKVARRDAFLRRNLRLEFLESRVVFDGTGTDACLPPAIDSNVAADVEDCESSATATESVRRITSEQELRDLLLDQAVERWRGLFGAETTAAFGDALYWIAMPVRAELAFQVNDSATTNVQVAGVDEGDVVKTDGEYLYVLGQDRQLTVIDIRDPEQMELVAKIPLELYPREIYVSDDRLTILSDQDHYSSRPWSGVTFEVVLWEPSDPEVHVSVYDISNGSAPSLVSTTKVDGRLIESRLVDSRVYLVTSSTLTVPELEVHCPTEGAENPQADETHQTADSASNGADLVIPPPQSPNRDCKYETEEQYRARVTPILLDQSLPQVETIGPNGETATDSLLEPENIYVDADHLSRVISVTLFDVSTEPQVVSSTGVITTETSNVYATEASIYIAGHEWGPDNLERTRVHQFTVGDTIEYSASGRITGRLLNQFSMDEYEGRLRIATTQGWGDSSASNLFVLKKDGDELKVEGSLAGLAPGESIFAARFIGDHAFLVTFRQIDPVFAIDLGDPAAPAVLGELKISGFSNYLHPVDSGFLVGIGRDADEGTGRAMDPQVSIFDVRDMAEPKLLDRETIPFGGFGWNTAFDHHHAVNFYSDLGWLTVPFEADAFWFQPGILEDRDAQGSADERPRLLDGAGSGDQTKPSTGLYIFQINTSAEAGEALELVGTISHDQRIIRSIRLGDVLYVISADTVTAHDIDDPLEVQGEVFYGRQTTDDTETVEVDAGPTTIDVLKNDRAVGSAKITRVDRLDSLGTVMISDDGASIVYKPPESVEPEPPRLAYEPYGQTRLQQYDRFTYTVELDNGLTETATVVVNLVHEPTGRTMAELARADLARRLNVDRTDIEIVQVESRTWSNGCLDANRPLQLCTAALVDGYLVVLAAHGKNYHYHTDLRTRVVFVEEDSVPVREGPQPDVFRIVGETENNKLDVLANDFRGVAFIRAPQVTAVTETRSGGIIKISEDGYSVLYTPPDGFTGEDEFSYTVDNGPSARVVVHVLDDTSVPPDDEPDGEPLVGIELEISDAAGNALEHVELGQTFYVNVYVDDLRPEGKGLFSAYLDIEYTDGLANVVGEIQHEEIYSNGKNGVTSNGLIDEAGAFTDSVKPLGSDRHRLMRIAFEATAAGRMQFATNSADNQPMHAVTVFGINSAINPRRVLFGDAAIEITNGMHNGREPTDVNGDAETTPLDVLNLINEINRSGSGPVHERMRLMQASGEAPGAQPLRHMYYDVNQDGFLTSIDALQIINRLNTKAREEQEAQRVANRAAHPESEGNLLVVDATFVGPQPVFAGNPINSQNEAAGESDDEPVWTCPEHAHAADGFFAELGM